MSLLSTAGSFLLGLKRTVYLLRLSSQEAKVFQQQVEQTPPSKDKVLQWDWCLINTPQPCGSAQVKRICTNAATVSWVFKPHQTTSKHPFLGFFTTQTATCFMRPTGDQRITQPSEGVREVLPKVQAPETTMADGAPAFRMSNGKMMTNQ